MAYCVGEAMDGKNFVDLKQVPEKVTGSIEMLARNSVHLVTLLAQNAYPGAE